jgi:hypothetical protein
MQVVQHYIASGLMSVGWSCPNAEIWQHSNALIIQNIVLHGVSKFNSGPSHNINLHLKGGMLKVSVDLENIITDLT